MNVDDISGRGAGRRSLGDRLGSSGDGDTERDEEVVNKSVMSRVVKVRRLAREMCGDNVLCYCVGSQV